MVKSEVALVPRQEQMLDCINKTGHKTVSELAQMFSVSEQTARRDIIKLSQLNLAARYRGGISPISPEPEPSAVAPIDKPSSLGTIEHSFLSGSGAIMVNKGIEERAISCVAEKTAIAKEICKLIPEGASLFITIGTTVERIAQELLSKHKLMVITNSMRVGSILYPHEGISLNIPSGRASAKNGGIDGPNTQRDLGMFRTDFFITSIGSVEEDGSLLDFNLNGTAQAQLMMQQAKVSILACDHTKFNSRAAVHLANLQDFDYVVVDQEPPSWVYQLIHTSKTKLIIAGQNQGPGQS